MGEPDPVWEDVGSEGSSGTETEEESDEGEEKEEPEEPTKEVAVEPGKSNLEEVSENSLSGFLRKSIETLHPVTEPVPDIDVNETEQSFVERLLNEQKQRLKYFEDNNIYTNPKEANEVGVNFEEHVTEDTEENNDCEDEIETEFETQEENYHEEQTEETPNFEERDNTNEDVFNNEQVKTQAEYYEEYKEYIKKDNSGLTEKDLEMLEYLDGKDGIPDTYAYSPHDPGSDVIIGDAKWKAMMEQIMYTSPFEDYIPLETKTPAEAIWEKWDRLDFNEGRYVDETEFDDPNLPTEELQVDVEEIKRLAKLLEEGKPIPMNF